MRIGRILIAIAVLCLMFPLACAEEEGFNIEDPTERLVEILQLTDEQLEQLETGTGILQLREDQVDILSGYVAKLLEDLGLWLDEAQVQEVEEILEGMLVQSEIDLEALGPIAEAIDDCISAMRETESLVSVYTSLRKLSTESAVPLQSENLLLDEAQLSTIVYTPQGSEEGDKHFENGMVWCGSFGLISETVGAANAWTGALAAYCDTGPLGGASASVSQRIVITVPADDTDITITAKVLHFTATIGTPAPFPIACGSVRMLTVSPSSGTGSSEWSYETLDPWFDRWDLASWLATIAGLGVGGKIKTVQEAVSLLNDVANIVDYMTALEERGEEETLICSATSLPAGDYVFEVGLSADASATAGYASAYAFGAVPEIKVTLAEDPIYFPDSNLEAAIREAIGKPTEPIYESDLVGLTHLYATDRNIVDLTGLEHCTSLTTLSLSRNQIDDISALAGLTSLTHLWLSHNQINDISDLANLTNLRLLDLDTNQISSVSSLSSLTGVRWLELRHNEIGNLSPLASLTNLTGLMLRNNQISDISPLASLGNLEYLELQENQISDIEPLEGLASLYSLYLDNNQLSDAELPHLAGLTSLTGLSLAGNQISDVSPLASLTSLHYLHLQHNSISNISPLADLTNLQTVNLHNNQISNILPLVENSGLGNGDFVSLFNNPLSEDSINIYIPELEARGVDVSY